MRLIGIFLAFVLFAMPVFAQEKGREEAKTATKASWKERTEDLHLGRAGLATDVLWGKIPPEIIEAAGGEARPRYFKWPVPGGRFGRGFGSGKGGKHKALDIVAPTGTPVLAATYGLIVWAGDKNGYGKTVIIVHPGGWVTLYAHLSKYHVKPGMKVKARQKIGAVGSTGISRGPHLHFMFFDNGVMRDPAPLMHPGLPHPPHVPPAPYVGHSVKKGQTPLEIAGLYELEVSSLLDANGLKPGEDLKPGWRIIIPKKMGYKAFVKGHYVVRKGDTLAAIAVLYDVSVKEIKAINDIPEGDLIKPGMKIRLPEGSYSGKSMSSKASGGEPEESGIVSYTVKEGDSLFVIARKHDTSIGKIVSLNGIKEPGHIKPGTKILVPSNVNAVPAKKEHGKKKKKPAVEKEEKEEEVETPETGEASGEREFNQVTEEDLDVTKVEGIEGEEIEVYEVNE